MITELHIQFEAALIAAIHVIKINCVCGRVENKHVIRNVVQQKQKQYCPVLSI